MHGYTYGYKHGHEHGHSYGYIHGFTIGHVLIRTVLDARTIISDYYLQHATVAHLLPGPAHARTPRSVTLSRCPAVPLPCCPAPPESTPPVPAPIMHNLSVQTNYVNTVTTDLRTPLTQPASIPCYLPLLLLPSPPSYYLITNPPCNASPARKPVMHATSTVKGWMTNR